MSIFFFFNDTATTEIYTLSLHDALPISSRCGPAWRQPGRRSARTSSLSRVRQRRDRKSTRLNSSHGYISYAVFCLKKKKKGRPSPTTPRARNPVPHGSVRLLVRDQRPDD